MQNVFPQKRDEARVPLEAYPMHHKVQSEVIVRHGSDTHGKGRDLCALSHKMIDEGSPNGNIQPECYLCWVMVTIMSVEYVIEIRTSSVHLRHIKEESESIPGNQGKSCCFQRSWWTRRLKYLDFKCTVSSQRWQLVLVLNLSSTRCLFTGDTALFS